MDWFSNSFRKVHVLYSFPEWSARYGEDFDPLTWVERLKASHIDTIETYAKDTFGNCWFKCDYGVQQRDIVGELLEYTRPAGIRLIAWYGYDNDSYAFARHPEWQIVNAEGVVLRPQGFGVGCINTEYREYTLQVMEQLVERYPIDGLWMEYQSIYEPPRNTVRACHCMSCRRKYRERFGRHMPNYPTVSEAREIYQWKVEIASAYTNEIMLILRKHRPDAHLTYFGAGTPMDAQDSASVNSMETHATEFPKRSFIARWLRSRGKPFELLSPTALPNTPDVGWCAWDQKPTNVLELDANIGFAQGASTVYGMQSHTTGDIDAVQLQEIGKVFERIEKLEPWVHDARSVAQVAIFLGTTPLQLPDLWNAAEANAGQWNIALLGGHALYDVVPDLARAVTYEAVIIPDSVALSDDDHAKLAEYVSNGGKLLVCGKTAFLNPNGDMIEDSLLAGILGIRLSSLSDHKYTYIYPGGTAAGKLIPEHNILAMQAPIEIQLAGAEMIVPMLLPESVYTEPTRVVWGFAGPDRSNPLPLVTVKRGAGLAMYVALPIETEGFKNVWSRQMAMNLIDMLLDKPWLKTNAPSGVEFVLNQQGDRHILHVIDHRVGDPVYGPAESPKTPAGIEVILASSVISADKASIAPTGEAVSLKKGEEGVTLTLPAFNVSLIVELTG